MDRTASEWRKQFEWPWGLMGANVARSGGCTGRGVTVKMIDTPVDSSHPDLRGKVRAVDTAHASGPSFHGTYVAGVIAGEKCGVAPGAKLISYPMGPRASTGELVAAFEWLLSQIEDGEEIDIVNLSIGVAEAELKPELWKVVHQVVDNRILIVCAVGNDGRHAAQSPGAYDLPLSVGACDSSMRVPSFSGSRKLLHQHHRFNVPDVVAPGVDVWSCGPEGTYRTDHGTSAAAAMASGVAALLWEQHPHATALEITDALCATAVRLEAPEERQGAGLVQFNAASARIKQMRRAT